MARFSTMITACLQPQVSAFCSYNLGVLGPPYMHESLLRIWAYFPDRQPLYTELDWYMFMQPSAPEFNCESPFICHIQEYEVCIYWQIRKHCPKLVLDEQNLTLGCQGNCYVRNCHRFAKQTQNHYELSYEF